MSTLICLTHVSGEDVTKQWLSLLFLERVLTWKAVFTPSFAGTTEEEHSLDDEISLWCSQFSGVLLSAFRDVFSRTCWAEACDVDLALRQTVRCSAHETQPLLSGSPVVGTGSECACELLFLKHQAALCPQALQLLWNPSCMKPIGQIPGHTQETAPPSSPSRALLWLLFSC